MSDTEAKEPHKAIAAWNDKIVIHADPDLEPLMPGFLENREQDITAIRQALTQGDFETIAQRGHTMTGVGAAYGFEYISVLGRHIKLAAQAQTHAILTRYLNDLTTYLNNVEIVYDLMDD
jgi:HPt (histidine-containing phosphotransfer) domain-containing protein